MVKILTKDVYQEGEDEIYEDYDTVEDAIEALHKIVTANPPSVKTVTTAGALA